MSEQREQQPGFHAIMMAAAYAEEGLADHARELLREGAGARPAERSGQPSRQAAWLGAGAGRPAGRTA